MDDRVTTSFIPKAALKVERTEVKRASPVALVNIIAGAILIVTILSAGGIFGFEKYLKTSSGKAFLRKRLYKIT